MKQTLHVFGGLLCSPCLPSRDVLQCGSLKTTAECSLMKAKPRLPPETILDETQTQLSPLNKYSCKAEARPFRMVLISILCFLLSIGVTRKAGWERKEAWGKNYGVGASPLARAYCVRL